MSRSLPVGHRGVIRVVMAFGVAIVSGALLLQPAEAAASLGSCYPGTRSDAAQELKADQDSCHADRAANPKNLGLKTLNTAEQKCLKAATNKYQVKLRSIQSTICGKPKPFKASVTEFCAAARRYLALDLTLPDNPDTTWLKYITRPLYDMAVSAPKDLKTVAVIVVMSEYGTRLQMLNALDDIKNQDFDLLRKSLGSALGAIPEKVDTDAKELPMLIAGVTRYCGFDMQAEIDKIIARELAR